MSTTLLRTPASSSPAGVTAWRDLLFVAGATLVTFLVAGLLELSEGVGGFLKHFEAYQLDEVPLAVAVLVIGLAWSSWRRSRQAERELALRLEAQERLAVQRAYFETLIRENLSASLITDDHGRITIANPELGRLFGCLQRNPRPAVTSAASTPIPRCGESTAPRSNAASAWRCLACAYAARTGRRPP